MSRPCVKRKHSDTRRHSTLERIGARAAGGESAIENHQSLKGLHDTKLLAVLRVDRRPRKLKFCSGKLSWANRV